MVWLYAGGVDGGGEDRRLCVKLVERLNENDNEITEWGLWGCVWLQKFLCFCDDVVLWWSDDLRVSAVSAVVVCTSHVSVALTLWSAL